MRKLIFVLIDGLRCDTAFRHMGFMEHMLEMNAASRYIVRSELPSMSRPLYEVLMTGVPVLEHGVFSNEMSRLSSQEHLFSLAVKNGLKTAAAAYHWFSELYNSAPFNPATDRLQLHSGKHIQNGIFYFTDSYPDSHLIADAEALRSGYNPDFMVVHSMNIDDAGHHSGSDSNDYVNAAIKIDYLLSNVIPLWLHHGYNVLVTADHGMNKWGGHGGNSDDERLVPLYLLGPSASGGDFIDSILPQLCIAPLCCHLLGIEKGINMRDFDIPGLKF